jgi:hypothetical protein
MNPFRAPRQVIKETEETKMDPIGDDMEEQKEQSHHDGVLCDGEEWMIEARKDRTKNALIRVT